MANSTDDTSDYRPGDKIRVRIGLHAGQRGIVQEVSNAEIQVALDSGEIARISPSELTNYSRAARRAWEAMPKKAGRPSSSSPKKMVSLRINCSVWEQLGEAVARGWIGSREEAINVWISERLQILFAQQEEIAPSREKDSTS